MGLEQIIEIAMTEDYQHVNMPLLHAFASIVLLSQMVYPVSLI